MAPGKALALFHDEKERDFGSQDALACLQRAQDPGEPNIRLPTLSQEASYGK